ncbi:MAG: ABC transporter ATP-binding protein [Bacteroidales bacterium]|nr:ABC transporter ATP-binding protein [Bacteroidales bacterium]MBN2698541.1 ABC transporter ATP-binding protein [Bacteroidales bacterium]
MENQIIEITDLTLKLNKAVLINNISLNIKRGHITGLVGESGSGKTMTALSMLRLLPPGIDIHTGTIRFNSSDGSFYPLESIPENILNRIRGNKIAMIFQEPMTSLNPSITCGKQIMEAIIRHKPVGRKEALEQTLELLDEMKLPDPSRIFKAWPHQLSGGQRQRIMIAMALSTNPEMLIADEPTTALDVTVQKSILDLLNHLGAKYNLSILFITHDLMVLKQIADDIIVMQQGEIVESGSEEKILCQPEKTYTKALIACKPKLEGNPARLPTIASLTGSTFERAEKKQSFPEKAPCIPLLTVQNLNVTYFSGRRKSTQAVKNVSFEVYEGETLGLVGESGSGKTTIGRTVLRLIEANSGKILYRGMNLTRMPEKEIRTLRKNFQIVFQDPYSSLNPRFTIGRMLREPMDIHNIGKSREERLAFIEHLMGQVGLEKDALNKYPHQFSGGQRQRIGIARALACRPEFIILDECVSSLDVSIQAQILNLLNDLKLIYGLTYIFISHDLTVVKYMSDRVIIMKSGEIIESGQTGQVYRNPEHEYTRKLIDAIPG